MKIDKNISIGHFGLIVTLLIVILTASGCSTSTGLGPARVTSETVHRITKTTHGFELVSPSPTERHPHLTFRLVRIDIQTPFRKVKYDEIKYTKPKEVTRMAFFPLWLAMEIITLGEIDIFETDATTVGTETRWEVDSDAQPKVERTPVEDAIVIVRHRHAGGQGEYVLNTNDQGIVSRDLRIIAKDVALDCRNCDSVEFEVEARPPYNCTSNVNVEAEEVLIRIWEHWNDRGYYNN